MLTYNKAHQKRRDYTRAAGQTLLLSPELNPGVALLNLASANMLGANRTNNREKASVLEDLSQRHTRRLLSISLTLCILDLSSSVLPGSSIIYP
jgi:hypothetical protein